MKTIKLIRTDFDQLEDVTFQYTDPYNCPLARAMKRMGFENVGVSCISINATKDGKAVKFGSITKKHIQKAADRLAKGKIGYAIVKLD